MDDRLKKKLLVGQAIIWALTMIGLAIVLVILDNLKDRFHFASVSFGGIVVVMLASALAQGHLRIILQQVEASGGSGGEQASDK